MRISSRPCIPLATRGEPPPIHVVWFKRDLRVHDHAPLCEATRAGRVLPLYVLEPEVIAAPDCAAQHLGFARECLSQLDGALSSLGAPLVRLCGPMPEVLAHLHAREPLDYGPGIHWPQVQMQSGVTGINAVRACNPVKQARDHGPAGIFVRRWIPALARIHAIRASADVRAQPEAVYQKHGSRRRDRAPPSHRPRAGQRAARERRSAEAESAQRSLLDPGC